MKIKKFLGLIFLGSLFFVGAGLANNVSANVIDIGSKKKTSDLLSSGPQKLKESVEFSSTSVPQVISNVIKFALAISGIVLLLIVVYAGILWMTSSGNPEKIGKSKKLLTSSAVGLAIILGAYSITDFVVQNITQLIT